MNYGQVLNELETLVADTFGLWEHNRVGFQWRHYTWNHTMRVRAMSMELGRREGGDVKLLEVAGTLHDITKRYDGVILTDDNGKRILDHNGFWLNEMLSPAGTLSLIFTKNIIFTEKYITNLEQSSLKIFWRCMTLNQNLLKLQLLSYWHTSSQ